MGKKKVPAMNTSSTADIAFLLLCYFLMTTTMGSQTGLSRRLPPMPDKNQKVEDQKVNRRNIIQVKINSADRILAGSEPIDVSQLKDKIKEFLTNPANDPNTPPMIRTSPKRRFRTSRVSESTLFQRVSSPFRMTVVPVTRPTLQSRTNS